MHGIIRHPGIASENALASELTLSCAVLGVAFDYLIYYELCVFVLVSFYRKGGQKARSEVSDVLMLRLNRGN